MRMATFSFADAFLQDDERLTSSKNSFLFNSTESLSAVSRLNHLDAAIYENALRLTATDSRKHTLYLDFTDITKNINLSDYRAAVFEMRISTAAEQNFVLGTYFQSGRIYNGSGENVNRISVPNDGEWHTVVMDLDEVPAIQGMLWGIRLELFSDTLRCTVGDTVDLASVRFFTSAEVAREELGLDKPETDPSVTQPVSDGESNSSGGDGKGCKSAGSVLPLFCLTVPAALCAARRRRKKDQA